jgi:cell division protein FtsQ
VRQSGSPSSLSSKTEDKKGKRWARKLVFGFFLFMGLVILLESPLARVRNISVTGNQTIPAADILAAAPVHQGMSLWQVNRNETQQAVMDKQPMISSVSVETQYLHGQVIFHVTEKHVVAILESAGKFYNLLNDGKVYNQVSSTGGFPWPIVTSGAISTVQTGQVPAGGDVGPLCTQLANLPVGLSAAISEIHLGSFGEAAVYLNNGFVAQCKVDSFANEMTNVQDAAQYFLGKGYAPGLIDMTGAPPYRYTPFQASSKKEGQP